MASYSPLPRPGIQDETKELEIHENNVTSDDGEASHPPIPPRTRTLRERLGNWEIMMLATSTVAIVVALAFLAMLWQYGLTQPDRKNKLAHAIALAGWLVKATTLSAVVIRIGVAVQAGVCTSLAAALLLEGDGVPLPDVLHFATLRSVTTAPPTILYPITRRFRLYARSAPAILIILIFLTATACQLASTILVSDFRIGSIDGPVQRIGGVIGAEGNSSSLQFARSEKIDYWGSRPLVYPPFGEFKEPGRTEEHAHDTGPTYQGMIPYQNATSRDLRRFEGHTSVFGSRVACVAPKIEATVQYSTDFSLRYLVGNATYAGVGKGLVSCTERNTSDSEMSFATISTESCAISFNCTIPYPNRWLTKNFSSAANETDTFISTGLIPVDEWSLALCAISSQTLWSFEKSLLSVGNDTAVRGVNTDITMVLNHTEHLSRNSIPQRNNSTTFSQVARSSGEWATYDLLSDGMVDLSLCFSELSTQPRRVEMISSYGTYDAQLWWDDERSTYDTSSIRHRFNSFGDAYGGRGIMDMQFLPMNESETLPGFNAVDFASIILSGLYKFATPGKVGTYIPMCRFCTGDDEMSIKVHPVTSGLFYDIVTSTRHPGIALQAIFNTIIQSAFYEELPSYNISLPIQIIRSQTVEYPMSFIGISVVGLLLVIYLALVATMVCLFAKRTKESLIGELWHSVGQVMTDVPQTLLNEHVGRTEDEIRAACRTTGLDRNIVGLSHSPRTGRMELRERT
ncbi:hypothetical protein CC86DRAFT_454688 [Ophiobolus disseminans]|uniref:Uncharacterized protein n=1 Tax=Ophiobolus disseminans TaxID=1469910 RepID=A0A6A7A3R7_9PLEO|nr:hypothetical protein CC86DRAFT_454688 [Ophiobolus disseminans]